MCRWERRFERRRQLSADGVSYSRASTTRTRDVPARLPVLAAIVTMPGAWAVTRPKPLTEAIDVSEEDHL